MIKQTLLILLLYIALIQTQITFASFSTSYLKYYYQPPRSVDYPFGDENFNEDMKGHLVQEQFHLVDLNETELYKPCLNESSEDTVDGPFSSNECEKCDLRKALENKDVILECYQCRDVANIDGTKSGYNNSILYYATYLEIVNYTSSSIE